MYDPLKLGIKTKSQHTIKARSLEAMLPTIILFVMSVSLPEQDTTRKRRVYKMYENAMYKNATRCTRTL